MRAALEPFTPRVADAARVDVEAAPTRQRATPRAAEDVEGRPATAADAARPGGELPEGTRPGTRVAVLRQTWPSYVCKEMGGLAWHAKIISVARTTALVSFTHARARDGRRYEDERLPWEALRAVA